MLERTAVKLIQGKFNDYRDGSKVYINNYFSEPRTDKVGISTVDGSITEIKFDSSSFYQWIEDNFTQPEDSSVLAEDTSWTTTSSKGAVFPRL